MSDGFLRIPAPVLVCALYVYRFGGCEYCEKTKFEDSGEELQPTVESFCYDYNKLYSLLDAYAIGYTGNKIYV